MQALYKCLSAFSLSSIGHCIMGNCLKVHVPSPQRKVRVVVSDGGQKEFKASKPKSSECCSLISDFVHSCSAPVSQKIVGNGWSRGRKVKIVVTRKQLELMIRNAEKFQSLKISFQCISGKEGCQKWRPSLAMIPEL